MSGEALIDLVVGADGSETPYPGGGPYNAARTIARLGQDVAFLGRLSDDAYGQLLRRRLVADGVRTDLVASTTRPTTVVRAGVDRDGVARYVFELEGTSAPGLTWIDAERALRPPPVALHAGTLGLTVLPIAETVARLIAQVSASTLVMIDINCRPGAVDDPLAYRQRMEAALRRADIVKASAEDLEFLAPGRPPAEVAAELVGAGAGVVLLTRGADAVVVSTHRGTFEVLVPPIRVVDTIGAGDAFGGGFLARWLAHGRGRDRLDDEAALRETVTFAVRVAAMTCERAGADPPLQSELD